jgi:hypothetical protein
MTDKRKEALEALAQIEKFAATMQHIRNYGGQIIPLCDTIRAALTQPQPVMGEDEIIEVINKAIADANIILKRSGDAATPIYRALKSSGIIKTDGGK